MDYLFTRTKANLACSVPQVCVPARGVAGPGGGGRGPGGGGQVSCDWWRAGHVTTSSPLIGPGTRACRSWARRWWACWTASTSSMWSGWARGPGQTSSPGGGVLRVPIVHIIVTSARQVRDGAPDKMSGPHSSASNLHNSGTYGALQGDVGCAGLLNSYKPASMASSYATSLNIKDPVIMLFLRTESSSTSWRSGGTTPPRNITWSSTGLGTECSRPRTRRRPSGTTRRS